MGTLLGVVLDPILKISAFFGGFSICRQGEAACNPQRASKSDTHTHTQKPMCPFVHLLVEVGRETSESRRRPRREGPSVSVENQQLLRSLQQLVPKSAEAKQVGPEFRTSEVNNGI